MTGARDGDRIDRFECERCEDSFDSAYAFELHTLAECPNAPRSHKEWINGGPLP